jgi:hypothetical protein
MPSAQANRLTTLKNKSSQDTELGNHLCERLFSLVQGPGVPFRRQFMPAAPVNQNKFHISGNYGFAARGDPVPCHAGVLFRQKNKS